LKHPPKFSWELPIQKTIFEWLAPPRKDNYTFGRRRPWGTTRLGSGSKPGYPLAGHNLK